MNANNYTGKITIFTVFWFIILILCGLATSNIIHTQNTIVSFFMFFIGFSAPIVFYRLTWIIIGKFNFIPKCRNKKCNARMYRIDKQDEEGVFYICNCGDMYLLTPQGHFKIIDSDGKEQPYRQKINGRWWPAPELFEKYSSKSSDDM